MQIDITSNLDEVSKDMSEFFLDQLPFVTSLTLNETIKDVRTRIIGPTWSNAFTVRNKALPGRMWRMKFSRKTDLEAVLYDSLGRDWVKRHITGGTKTSPSGGRLAIPVNPNRTATGRIPKGKKPRAVTAKKSTQVIRWKGGKSLIVERFKGETYLRYVLAPSAKIDRSFRFYDDAVDETARVIDRHFNEAMDRALRTSKFIHKK